MIAEKGVIILKWSILLFLLLGLSWWACAEQGIVNVAHRGLSPGFPENTLAAFRNSIEMGITVIEVDLRVTKDGEVVILHDETVDRTTNGRGKVSEFTLEELKKLDAGRWAGRAFVGERIPTYEEALRLVQGTGVKLLLDIKISPNLDYEKIVRLTEQYGAVDDVIVGVRSVSDLRAFQALNPDFKTLGFMPGEWQINEFAQAGVDIIRLWPEWIYKDASLINRVRQHGLPVWTTAGMADRAELIRLIDYGVDGILTDRPGLLQEILEELGRTAK